jgi:hypothetical protein
MEMGLRRARELVVLMAKEFQPYGATWAQLKNKSGMARTTFKRGFDFAKERKWFVGGGGQNKPFFLNPDGSWRASLNPDGVGPSLAPETVTGGPSSVPAWTGDSKIDRIITLASEAIQHANKG